MGVLDKEDDEDEQNSKEADHCIDGASRCTTISYFLDSINTNNTTEGTANGNVNEHDKVTRTNNGDAVNSDDTDTSLFVPQKILKSNASWCFDIVMPSDWQSA